MKTILLIGGYGFLGMNILKYIEDKLKDRYQAIVFDKFPTNRSNLVLDCVVKSYTGDFSDSMMLERLFVENEIDLVIHSLSTTIPSLSFNARYDVESNLVPTIELLNCMERHHVKDIVYISSGGAIYGDSSDKKHKENEDVFPISSYGVVKLAIEKYLMQYAELFGFRPLILRLSNPYGPFHYSKQQGVCNVAIDAALSGEPFVVWGNGDAKKDYIYVTDFVAILFLLLKKGVCKEVVNVGSGKTASVNKILGWIRILHPSFSWTYGDASKYDVSQFELDTEKLYNLIGDYQFVDIDEGLKRTFEWQRALK
jgi:UDP-glucose 4-epimerase